MRADKRLLQLVKVEPTTATVASINAHARVLVDNVASMRRRECGALAHGGELERGRKQVYTTTALIG